MRDGEGGGMQKREVWWWIDVLQMFRRLISLLSILTGGGKHPINFDLCVSMWKVKGQVEPAPLLFCCERGNWRGGYVGVSRCSVGREHFAPIISVKSEAAIAQKYGKLKCGKECYKCSLSEAPARPGNWIVWGQTFLREIAFKMNLFNNVKGHFTQIWKKSNRFSYFPAHADCFGVIWQDFPTTFCRRCSEWREKLPTTLNGGHT